jgi:hypothetical protein
MNLIAQQALARAMTRPAVTTPAPQPVCLVATTTTTPVQAEPERVGPESRVLYLEGRRHATDIVLSAGHSLSSKTGQLEVLDKLRRCAVGKPPSFARGVAEIAELLEQEANRG